MEATATFETILAQTVKEAVAEALREHDANARPALEGSPTLTAKEAADLIGISLPKMYDITRRADFDALLMVDSKKLILRHKLMAWMNRQTEGDRIG